MCLVVSEERGTISVARNGGLRVMADLNELAAAIAGFLEEKAPPASPAGKVSLLRHNAVEKLLSILTAALFWLAFVRRP
jgi:hypothetical protein